VIKTRSIPYWTTSVFSSTATDLDLVVRWLALPSWTLNFSILSRLNQSESESYVTTDGQLASLSWNKAPFWSSWPDFYFCLTVAGLLIWGAPSDERTGLSFAIANGPRQRSHSRVRVPWNSRPYFTVSDLRLPFSSPPTTRKATVEVFDPASTRDLRLNHWSHEQTLLNWSELSFCNFEANRI
jgi:hypothetical protein